MRTAEEWATDAKQFCWNYLEDCCPGQGMAKRCPGPCADLLKHFELCQADARESALKEAAYSYKVPELQNKDAELVALRFCQQFRVAILSLLAKDETP